MGALKLVEAMENDKQKALSAALKQIEQAFGKGSVMRMGADTPAMEIEAISTGSARRLAGGAPTVARAGADRKRPTAITAAASAATPQRTPMTARRSIRAFSEKVDAGFS